METTIVNLIQSMLAPGIMISACGLLLLGTNNKYSIVVNRIRVLDEEKRKLTWNNSKENLKNNERERLNNIQQQLLLFYQRIKVIRNAVSFYTAAVALFIITSLCIGINYFSNINITTIALSSFLLGMISVLLGSLFMLKEIMIGYKIVTIEVQCS